MLQQASDEVQPTTYDRPDYAYTRQMYIQGLSFLLRALPQDLSVEERLSIRSALPADMVEPIQLMQDGHKLPQASSATRPSILQRALASSIVQGFILLQAVVPHIVHASATIYQYDREHHVVENIAATGLQAVNGMGRSGIVVGGKLLALSDGNIGRLVKSVGIWFIDGVAGGLNDGIGEVMRMANDS